MALWDDARKSAAAALLAAAVLHAPAARADDAADQKAAHEAYERGARAYGQGSFAVAATEFARADELRPTAAALEMALKASISTEDPVLAMTLVDRAASRPADAHVEAQLARARDRFADKVGRLSILCPSPCSAKVGNEPAQVGVARYYRAGNYVIEITSGGSPELFAVQLPGGATMEWKPPSKAPPPVEPRSSATPVGTVTPLGSASAAPLPSAPLGSATASGAPIGPRSTGISPAWFFVGAGVTVVAASLTVGFGVDTLARHDAFVANRTPEAAAAGQGQQNATNAFLGVTLALAAGTAILGYFTFRTPRPDARALRSAPRTAWTALDLQMPFAPPMTAAR
jgi:hypothetical protein